MDDVELLKNLEHAYQRVCLGAFDRDAVLVEIERLEREVSERFDVRIRVWCAITFDRPRRCVQ